jgi:hypothetical protein
VLESFFSAPTPQAARVSEASERKKNGLFFMLTSRRELVGAHAPQNGISKGCASGLIFNNHMKLMACVCFRNREVLAH